VLGQARAVYRSGAAAGTDVVQARIEPHGQATVEIKVLAVDPLTQNLTIAASPSEVEPGGTSVVTATLTDADGPVPGIKGAFSFQSNQTSARLTPVDVSTNAQGQISANYQAGERAGVDIVEVNFEPSLAATVNITVGTPTSTITISPKVLPEAEQYVDYSNLLTATGGRPGYTFSVASGSALPPGVTLNSNGVVAGNGASLRPGTYSFVVQVKDAAGRTKLETISLTVKEPSSSLAIDTTALSEATIGVTYSDELLASGGKKPYAWSVAAGSALPGWASLSSGGIVSGMPVGPAGETSFIVQVQDANGATATQRVTLSIKESSSSLTIVTTSLNEATIGVTYSDQLQASGGKTPYTWSIAAGSALPRWASLSSSGVVSGTPTGTAGDVSFIVRVEDDLGEAVQQRVTLTVK